MLSSKQIKIIKRAERNNPEAGGSAKRPASVQKEKTKPNAVSIVTEWVNELRRAKSEERANGFAQLFGSSG